MFESLIIGFDGIFRKKALNIATKKHAYQTIRLDNFSEAANLCTGKSGSDWTGISEFYGTTHVLPLHAVLVYFLISILFSISLFAFYRGSRSTAIIVAKLLNPNNPRQTLRSIKMVMFIDAYRRARRNTHHTPPYPIKKGEQRSIPSTNQEGAPKIDCRAIISLSCATSPHVPHAACAWTILCF